MGRVEIMKACLAEAGFPDVKVSAGCGDPNACDCGWPTVHFPGGDCDDLERATHRAFLVMGCPDTPECFLCWAWGGCDEHAPISV